MAAGAVKTFVQMCSYLQQPCHVARFQHLCGVQGTFSDKAGSDPSGSDLQPGLRKRGIRDPDPGLRNGVSGDSSLVKEGEEDEEDDEETTRPETTRAKPLRRNSLTGDVGQEFLIHNRFLFYLFTLGTELGNEMFFIIFFPFLHWNIDALVSRRLIVVWAWNLFVGQSAKDMVRWSRPDSPPVVKVEVFYNSEYSMPSTHAMTGTAIPFCLFMLTYGRWEYTFVFGLCVALSWSVLVCVSRVYMGMHSVLEVITGFLFSLLILTFFHQVLDKIDDFYMTDRYAPLVIVLVHVGFGLVAFSLDSWSTSRGDTAQALGTGVGVALGSHVNYQLGLLSDPPLSSLPLTLPSITAGLVLGSVLRFLLGVAVLLLTRTGMKALTIPFLCRLFGKSTDDVRQARQRMEVELPYRYMVYSVVGFACVCVVPLLFMILNIA